MEHIDSLSLSIDILVKIEWNVSQPSKLLIIGGLDLFLFSDKALLMLDVFSVIQIGHVLLAASVSQVCELVASHGDILFCLHDQLKHSDLFVLDLHVFWLQLV